MHDGRFKKLNHVLNHYTKEIIESPTLAPELKKGISLSSDEKTDLIAFLLTLNDKNFVFNSDFQYPKNILGVGEGNSK
jgi:cytochrome c peroxidase